MRSIKGTKNVNVLYFYDSNEIITEPLKDITGKEILRDYNKVHDVLDNSGSKPETNWMENEASEALKKLIGNNQ